MLRWDTKPTDTNATILVEGQGFQSTEPYVQWYHRDDAAENTIAPRDKAILPLERLLGLFENVQPAELGKSTIGRESAGKVFGDGALVPMPPGSLNESPPGPWRHSEVADALPDVDDDTIIVGVIDTGISLGHRHFRDAEGKTRIISAWQQGAQFDAPAPGWRHLNYPKRSKQLPFGREVFQEELNEAIQRHSRGDLTGWLDEDAFNRELALVDPLDATGQRDLDHRAAHGTHIMDLAAGHVPIAQNAKEMAQQKIIAVGLPAQHAHGTAGNFLPFFAIYAIERILFIADALWIKNNPGAETKQKGYPIVINFSYGMQAGPKDGSSLYEELMNAALTKRIEGANSPVRIVMPVGNENLNRGAASIILGNPERLHVPTNLSPSPKIALPIQLSPADETANYCEIWTERQPNTEEIEEKVRFYVTPPGHDRMLLPMLRDGQHVDLTQEVPGLSGGEVRAPVARLYCQDKPSGEKGQRRRFTFCTAPTLSFRPGAVLAPAGTWLLEIEYDGKPIDFNFHIQSDQSAVRKSPGGKRAYFDHPNYDSHVLRHTGIKAGVFGGERDAYHYDPYLGCDDAENWTTFGPVQRRGTHNALNAVASIRLGDGLLCIGGYDEVTGRPAIYSGTSSGDPNDKKEERTTLSVSFPSESAPNHFGVLAAGAKNGSVVAYRGTSMSTAIATRYIVERFSDVLAAGGTLDNVGTETALRSQAKALSKEPRLDHWGQDMRWGYARVLKLGVERMPFPESFFKGRRKRLGV